MRSSLALGGILQFFLCIPFVYATTIPSSPICGTVLGEEPVIRIRVGIWGEKRLTLQQLNEELERHRVPADLTDPWSAATANFIRDRVRNAAGMMGYQLARNWAIAAGNESRTGDLLPMANSLMFRRIIEASGNAYLQDVATRFATQLQEGNFHGGLLPENEQLTFFRALGRELYNTEEVRAALQVYQAAYDQARQDYVVLATANLGTENYIREFVAPFTYGPRNGQPGLQPVRTRIDNLTTFFRFDLLSPQDLAGLRRVMATPQLPGF